MGYVALAVFVAVWAWVAWIGKTKSWTGTMRHGGGFLAGAVAVAVLGLVSDFSKPEPPPKPLTAAEQHEQKVRAQFSGWDGSHRNLVDLVKRQMNDADSFEHVETRYWDRGDHLSLRMTFRGNNAFGAKVINEVAATADMNGRILSLETVDKN